MASKVYHVVVFCRRGWKYFAYATQFTGHIDIGEGMERLTFFETKKEAEKFAEASNQDYLRNGMLLTY